MPPCRCLSRSLVALAVELVHRWDTPLVNLAVAEVGSVPGTGRDVPSRALRCHSVRDAPKRDFAYLRQRPFRAGVSTLRAAPVGAAVKFSGAKAYSSGEAAGQYSVIP